MGTLKEWQEEFFNNQVLQHNIDVFVAQYGISGIEKALQIYSSLHHEYICKNKSSISKFDVNDIFYLEIQEHNISIYTKHGIYKKYGTLTKELKFLASFGFVRCSQNCIVSLGKIRTIQHNNIILIDCTKIHLSRNYAAQVIISYSQYHLIDK